MNEREYQRKLVRKLKKLFPGCVVIENDPSKVQGIPDLVILFRDRWAMLEVKIDVKAKVQPNQMYYVEKFDEMSFATFICPENEQEILDELQLTFGAVR